MPPTDVMLYFVSIAKNNKNPNPSSSNNKYTLTKQGRLSTVNFTWFSKSLDTFQKVIAAGKVLKRLTINVQYWTIEINRLDFVYFLFLIRSVSLWYFFPKLPCLGFALCEELIHRMREKSQTAQIKWYSIK